MLKAAAVFSCLAIMSGDAPRTLTA